MEDEPRVDVSAVAFLELAVVLAFFASLGVLELVIKRMEKRRGRPAAPPADPRD